MDITDVVHADTGSNTHISVAKQKMAITLCSTTVSPSAQKHLEGKFQTTNALTMHMASFTTTLLFFSGLRLSFFFW